MEDVNYAQDDEMDEGDEDEEEDVDMEYADESDSEATSNSDDVDAEEDDGDDEDESHGDGWRDEDEDYEEADLIENDEDGEARVAAVTGADQVLDEDMMWQVCLILCFARRRFDFEDTLKDVGDEGDAEDENGDEGDEDDGGGWRTLLIFFGLILIPDTEPVNVIHVEQDDEPDMSDDEEYGYCLRIVWCSTDT